MALETNMLSLSRRLLSAGMNDLERRKEKNMIRRLVPLGASLMLFAGCATTSRVDLQPKLAPDVEAHYIMTSRYDLTQEVEFAPGETPHKFKSIRTSEVGMWLRCVEVKDDGSAVIEWALPYITMSEEGDKSMSYDSRDPAQADSPAGRMFAQLINQPATLTVSASGEVVSYQKPASIGKGPIRQFASSLMSQKVYERAGLFAIDGAPVDPAIGAAWTATNSAKLPQGLGTLLTISGYMLEGTQEGGKVAEIAVKGTMAMQEPEPNEDDTTPAQPRFVVETGEFSVKTLWDCVAGQVITSESTSQLIGTTTGSSTKAIVQQIATISLKRVAPEEFGLADQTPPSPAAEVEDTQEGIEN